MILVGLELMLDKGLFLSIPFPRTSPNVYGIKLAHQGKQRSILETKVLTRGSMLTVSGTPLVRKSKLSSMASLSAHVQPVCSESGVSRFLICLPCPFITA